MNPNQSHWTIVSKESMKKKMNNDRKKMPPTTTTSQDSNIKETMAIESDLIGFVVGRKGSNFDRLKKIYGVKFTLPPKGVSHITIEGPAERVSAAKKDIEQNLSCKTSFFIEKDYIGLVTGKGGEKKNAMEDALNVRIRIKEDGEVVVLGTRCEEAKKAIEENVSCVASFFFEKDFNDFDENVVSTGKESSAAKRAFESMIERFKTAFPYQEKFSIPALLTGYVCGKNGSNRKRIELNYGVHMYVPPAVAKNETQTIFVSGSEAENVSAAKQAVLEDLESLILLDLDESFVGGIIGSGGQRIRRLEMEYGVGIKVEPKHQQGMGRRKVYILGEKSRTKAAKDDIISLITGRKKG